MDSKNNPENRLSVLDAYHRNRAIGRFVKNAELAGQLRQLLYAGEISALLERLETALNQMTDEKVAPRSRPPERGENLSVRRQRGAKSRLAKKPCTHT